MAERAAHLIDHVFPAVPVRQWVLSLPHRLRYVLAWDHALCRAVTGVFVWAVLGFLRRRARQAGARGGRGGILRFHEAMPPTDDEMDRLLATIDRRVHRLLGGTASICRPPSSCRRGIERGSNGCAATRSVLPSPPTDCT